VPLPPYYRGLSEKLLKDHKKQIVPETHANYCNLIFFEKEIIEIYQVPVGGGDTKKLKNYCTCLLRKIGLFRDSKDLKMN